MKVCVKVKTNSKTESVKIDSAGLLNVRVNTPPIDGKANQRVIELLAKYFKKPKSSIHLIHGKTSKNKVFEIF
jgi:uncharacterized protein (TIGR00251 family)